MKYHKISMEEVYFKPELFDDWYTQIVKEYEAYQEFLKIRDPGSGEVVGYRDNFPQYWFPTRGVALTIFRVWQAEQISAKKLPSAEELQTYTPERLGKRLNKLKERGPLPEPDWTSFYWCLRADSFTAVIPQTDPCVVPEKLFLKIFFGEANMEEYYAFFEEQYGKYKNEVIQILEKGEIPREIGTYFSKRKLDDEYYNWKSEMTKDGTLPSKKQLKNMNPEELDAWKSKAFSNNPDRVFRFQSWNPYRRFP